MTELLPLTPDELLTTTRAVRKRLDLSRAVERDIVEECIAIALQAPSGSNRQAWQWVPVDDPQTKSRLADLYREVFDAYRAAQRRVTSRATPAPTAAPPSQRRRCTCATTSTKCPVLLVVFQEGRVEELPLGSQPGFWGSVVPAIWSFMLALRARGLGSTWTTMTCRRSKEVAELLGVPHDSYTQIGMFPVAYTIGTDFKPAARLDPSSVIHWNSW